MKREKYVLPNYMPISLPDHHSGRLAQSVAQALLEQISGAYPQEDAHKDKLQYWPAPLPLPGTLPDPLTLFLSDAPIIIPEQEQRSVIPMTLHEILARRSRDQLKPSMQLPLGLIDKPELLQREHFLVDLHSGPLLLAGPPSSGKANALSTILLWLATRFLPEQFRCAIIDPLHELDFFQELPHLRAEDGTLMWSDGSSDEKLGQFVYTLNNEFQARSEAHPYQRWHDDSLAQIWAQGIELPQFLLIVSNYQAFSERVNAASTLKKLALLTAEARTMGLYLIVSSTEVNSHYLAPELLDKFSTKIGLQLNEQQRSKLFGATTLLYENGPGRGLALTPDQTIHEVQLALAAPGINEPQRYEALKHDLQWLAKFS